MSENPPENNPLFEQVEKALESIRPFLQSDRGDVRVLEITEDHTVKVELLGACSSCRMSTMTMKAGVEEAIKNLVPSIKSVIAVNSDNLETV